MAQGGRRHAWAAAVLSFIAPGLGQVYNLQWTKGVPFLLSVPACVLVLSFSGALRYRIGLVTDFALQLLMSVWASMDAYRQERGPTSPQSKPKMLWRLCAVILAGLGLAGLDFTAIRSVKTRAFKIPTGIESMSPTLRPGDRFVVDMGYYESHNAQDGDVIALAAPDRTTLITKRIVASPGETIQGEGEHIYLNGKLLGEPYAVYARHGSSYGKFGPLTLPAERFFVLGDDRDHSWDSRAPQFGPIRREDIKGKVLYIYWSKEFSRIGRYIR